MAAEGVEDAVDEADALIGGEAAGEFDGFIDDDGSWGIGVDHLVGGDPEDIAVDVGHAGDAPVLGVAVEEGVELLEMFEGAVGELIHELVPGGAFFVVVRVEGGVVGAGGVVEGKERVAHVPLVEDLEGAAPGLVTRGH